MPDDDFEYTGADLRPHSPDTRRRGEVSRFWKVFAFFIGSTAMALVVGVVVLLVNTASTTQSIRSAQKDSRSTQLQSAQVLQVVLSCTTPGKTCSQRNAAAVAGAIDTLSARNAHTAAVAAAAAADCATRHQGFTAIYRCVRERLAADAHRRP